MKKYIFVLIAGLIAGFATAQTPETPAKTVIIKNPAAHNTVAYFSAATTYYFEVFKSGGSEGIAHVTKSLADDPAVRSIIPGKATGEYQSFSLELKTPQTKGWFSTAFKNAGLTHIKINNNEIVRVEKL